MDLHRVIVFVHVAAMVGLFATLVIEWVSIARLRQSTSYEQAREWAGMWRLLAPVGAPSILTLLASGIYLATTLGAWKIGWVQAAVPTLIVIAIAGAVASARRKRLQMALAERSGPMSHELWLQMRHPLLTASIGARVTLIGALVFVMTARPALGGGVLVGSTIALGSVVGALVWRTTSTSAPRQRSAGAESPALRS